jgi:hypothetical protein
MAEMTSLPTTAEELTYADTPHDYTPPPDVAINFPDDRLDDSQSLLGHPSAADATAKSVWTMDYYRVFFNVSTREVLGRLVRCLLPFRSDFYSKTETPDMYGPFWIVTTLVVILAVTGNFASFIHSMESETQIQWKYDFEKVTIAASVFYTMLSIVPLLVYLALRRIGVTGSNLWITHILSLYGYSFFSYVPAAVLCVIPIETVRWVAILLCFLLSSYFLGRNIRSYFPVDQLDWDNQAKAKGTMLLIMITLGHFAVAIITKFYFFQYSDA